MSASENQFSLTRAALGTCGRTKKQILISFGFAVALVLAARGSPLDNWTGRVSGVTNQLLAVTFANNTFIAVGKQGTILRSTNGADWTRYTGSIGEDLYGVTYGKGKFAAIGYLADAFDSTDRGVTWSYGHWTRVTFYPFGGIAYANGLFVIAGLSGIVMTSPDAVSWSQQTSGVGVDLNGLAVGCGQFAAAGNNGTIITSPNATNWTTRASGTTLPFVSLGGGPPRLIAGSGFGTISSSRNGTNWAVSTPAGSSTVRGAGYASGVYLIVGGSGKILTSPDGTNWVSRTSGVTTTLRAVTFGLRTFVVVGDGGVIRQSDNLGDISIRWTGAAELTISAQPGQTCSIQSKDTVAVDWVTRDTIPITAPSQVWVDPNPSSTGARYYRGVFSP
jgi:hypothetical protein